MNSTNPNNDIRQVMREVVHFTDTMRANRRTVDFIANSTGASLSKAEHFAHEAHKDFPERSLETHREVGLALEEEIAERKRIIEAANDKATTPGQLRATIKEWEDGLKERIKRITGNENDYYKYNKTWRRRVEISRTSRTLHNSLLITAVSDFESLISGLVRTFLTLRPDILKASSKTYTFKELSDFSSIEEFRTHCIEVRSDDILRQGFEKWMKWFSEERNIGLSEVTDDNPALTEIFQRRHLLVHNGGVVNSYYLAKSQEGSSAKIGQKLSADEEYLRESLDVLTIAGVKLGIATSRKLVKSDEAVSRAAAYLHRISYNSLVDGAWRVARELSVWQDTNDTDESTRLTSKVNAWLAAKLMGNFPDVEADIKAWDTRALANKYRLAKAALLDDNDGAYNLAKSMAGSGELGEEEWRYWPLLKDVRAYEGENVQLEDRLWAGSYADLSKESL